MYVHVNILSLNHKNNCNKMALKRSVFLYGYLKWKTKNICLYKHYLQHKNNATWHLFFFSFK